MKLFHIVCRIAVITSASVLCQCASSKSQKIRVAAILADSEWDVGGLAKGNPAEKAAAATDADDFDDDLDEYSVVEISDPLELVNRGTFWLNDKMYLVLFRPLSKGYEKLVPQRARNGLFNAFENVKYPVRLVNALLTGKVDRAGLHTGKFLLNTIAGMGGLVRVSDRYPTLADLPEEDTGKTFAKWGIGHGPYIVIPFLGPSSFRDGIGLTTDYALTPTNWGIFWYGKYDWTAIPPSVNTLRMLPGQLAIYDEAVRDAIDPYIAVRSGYVQFRRDAVTK